MMGADGSNPRRISFGEGRYTTPVWSPTGEFIAFTKQTGGEFHIGVMKPDGSDERMLTSSYLDEGPTWAPNGRVLMFSREAPGGGSKLWTVDVTGRILQPVPYPGARRPTPPGRPCSMGCAASRHTLECSATRDRRRRLP